MFCRKSDNKNTSRITVSSERGRFTFVHSNRKFCIQTLRFHSKSLILCANERHIRERYERYQNRWRQYAQPRCELLKDYVVSRYCWRLKHVKNDYRTAFCVIYLKLLVQFFFNFNQHSGQDYSLYMEREMIVYMHCG